MKKFLGFSLVLVLAVLFLSQPQTTRAESAAVTGGSLGPLADRLDRIEKKQNEILAQLAEIKEELQIVKIRASLKA